MRTNRFYQPLETIYPINGIDTFDPSTQLDPHRMPEMLNMELIKGEVAKRQGYILLGDALTDPVIGVVEFQAFSGTKTLLAFTTKKQYKYDSGSNTWTNITYQSASVDVDWTGDESNTFDYVIASGNDAGVAQVYTVTFDTPTSGDVYSFSYTDSAGAVTTVQATLGASTAANAVTQMKAAIAGDATLSGLFTTSGTTTLIVTAKTGGISYSLAISQVSGTGTPSGSVTTPSSKTYTTWIIITNGKDQPRYWDGSMSKFALYTPTGLTGFVTCGALAQFNDHVLLGNVTLSSAQPTSIYWSETQELLKFSDVLNLTGAAILPDVQGQILKFVQLGDRMMIYSDNAIHSMLYVQGQVLFSFEKVLQETRLLSARSIANIGPFHLFMSQENIIFFDGSKLTGPIGNRVYRSYRDELFASNRKMAFAFHDVAKLHVYFCYPIAGNDSQFYKAEYSLGNIQGANWTKIKYIDRATSMGFFSRDQNLTCDSTFLLGVKCSGLNLRCDQGSVKGAFPVRVFGTSGGRVALCDDTVPNDNGTAAESYIDTKDFNPPPNMQSQLTRWTEIELDLKGFEVEVWTSVDQGRTYQLVENLNLKNEWQWFFVPIDLMSRTLRVRLRNACPSSSFTFRDIKVWGRPSGPTPSA